MADQLPMLFDERFLERHAGVLIADPLVALGELIANCWDAGARNVHITWPDDASGQQFSISDDGIGMTPAEFGQRWRTFDYNRRAHQGPRVTFPPGVDLPPRVPFGRNGRGRYAALCFGDSYTVTTAKDGTRSGWRARRADTNDRPLDIERIAEDERTTSTGTRVQSTEVRRVSLSAGDARTEIGLRFLADPNFSVHLDGVKVEFDDIPESFVVRTVIEVEGYGQVTVLMIDVQQGDRTTRQHGIAWRVGPRLVGEVGWKGARAERLLDGRSTTAKRYTFLVLADVLEEAVLPDWTGFNRTHGAWEAVSKAVFTHIEQALERIQGEHRREVADRVRQRHHARVRRLPPLAREVWNKFVDEAQKASPSISERDLADLAGLLANLELASTGYDLLGRLATQQPGDLDALNGLMTEWTVATAKVVLDEIRNRVSLVDQLARKVADTDTDEVHDLQPLFHRGLWIFGPEFETIEFTSNVGMTAVIQHLFRVPAGRGSRQRPDFAILPDSTVGLYSYPRYDADGGEVGCDRLVIIELKKPGIAIGTEEKSQAYKYVTELQERGHIGDATNVRCFVLGDRLHPRNGRERKEGDNVVIVPMVYQTVLERARTRLFRLHERVKGAPFLQDMKEEIEKFEGGDESVQRNLDL